MEEIVKALTAEEAVEKILECKVEVWNEIKSIQAELKAGDTRMNDIEGILSKHEEQRNTNSEVIREELLSLRRELLDYRKDFDRHDSEEMEKYDHIIVSLTNLKEQIIETSGDFDSHKKQAEIDEAIKEAVDEERKPAKDRMKYAINSAIGVVVTATLAGVWELIEFLVAMRKVLTGE